ncbi:toll-interacting protein-like [Culicoides brevitarsis]|uniref:toll-interacting protein-like n=1 Tax=Culicoides brevitarsis TaxID=469753 RepID=UPI00307B9905
MTTERVERWKKAVIGPLAPDFLRLQTPQDIQEAVDRQTCLALSQQQQIIQSGFAPNIMGRLSITVVQAKLVKNYGLSRMDPYVRLRVGHFIYETQTDPNGARNPRFDRTIHTQLPHGVKSLSLEIYDECQFTMDELIAWAEIKIPDAVLKGETVDEWYCLSGKQGEALEGQIHLVMSFSTTPVAYNIQPYSQTPGANMVMVPNVGSGRQVFVHPQQMHPIPQQQQQVPVSVQPPVPVVRELSDVDVQQISEMFPNIDTEVIKSVGEANRGNREATVNSLLSMTN